MDAQPAPALERQRSAPAARLAPEDAAPVSSDQIAALVSAACRLRRRQQDRPTGAPGADARHQRLDWAIRAGRLALAERGTVAGAGAGEHLTAPW